MWFRKLMLVLCFSLLLSPPSSAKSVEEPAKEERIVLKRQHLYPLLQYYETRFNWTEARALMDQLLAGKTISVNGILVSSDLGANSDVYISRNIIRNIALENGRSGWRIGFYSGDQAMEFLGNAVASLVKGGRVVLPFKSEFKGKVYVEVSG